MVEAHAGTELDHSRGFGRRQRVDRNAQLRRGADEQCRVAHRLGRGDEQQSVGSASGSSRMRRTKPSSSCPVDGASARIPESAGEFGRGDVPWDLEQGQRNATGLGDDAVPHVRVDAAQHHRIQ